MTQGQVSFFETFGSFVFRQEFLSDEVENINSAAEAVWEEELGRRVNFGEEMHTVPFVERHSTMTHLVKDDRI